MKFMHELDNMDFYSPRMIWLWPWLSAQSARSRECWVPDVALFPRMISRLTVWLHWTASITEGRAFCSYWNRHSQDMDLSSLHIVLLPKLLSVDLQNALSSVMVLYTVLFLNKELTLQQKSNVAMMIWMCLEYRRSLRVSLSAAISNN